MRKILAFCVALCAVFCSQAQKLSAGFDAREYRECISMASHFRDKVVDSVYFTEPPQQFVRRYTSDTLAFDNVWELWQRPDSVLAVSIRGSVMTEKSWMSNFHAAMVPARGEVFFGRKIAYDLCNDERANVHVGWLVSMLALTEDIENKLDELWNEGYRDVIITGHSQGGAICYLLTMHLLRQQAKGLLHNDLRFKTYCSAAPKPGDYNFALEYETTTQDGLAFNVVNADDWVPEVPLSVQKLSDMRPSNPFSHIDDLLAEASKTDKIKINFLLGRLANPLRKSERHMRRYLGNTVGKMLAEKEPSYSVPEFSQCANYSRCGRIIVLKPDSAYHAEHPQVAKDPFEHHTFKAYGQLADKLLK